MTSKLRLSVIMSVYNNEEYLDDAIVSILNQTYKKFEFIIIDDGSTDNSLEIIKKYASLDNRIKIISRENKGLIYSLNEAIIYASGIYLARMDGDDICLVDRFEKQMNILEDNINIDMVFSDSILIDNKNNELCKTYRPKKTIDIITGIPYQNYIVHPSVIYKKSLVLEMGMYDSKAKGVEDVVLWNKMKENNKVFYYLPIIAIKYRINPKSVRGIDSNKYKLTLAKEMIVNRRASKIIHYFKYLTYLEITYLLCMSILPYKIISYYSRHKNKQKINKILI